MSDGPDICIHHSPCQDGYTAAWAVWRKHPDIAFHPGVFGEPPPDVEGKDVVIVDFSYKRRVLKKMLRSAKSVTILDHHASAQTDLAGLNTEHDNVTVVFDMNKSGAMLAWEHFHAEPSPQIVRIVEDRDLWRFHLPGTREISAVLFSYDYSFNRWTQLAEQMENPTGREMLMKEGEAIERKHHKDIRELLEMTTRNMVIGGHKVPVANLPYTMASDAANRLAEGRHFAACYTDMSDRRVFSLRSRKGRMDVSAIASAYGGGGHHHAAGFSRPLGWEGDAPEPEVGDESKAEEPPSPTAKSAPKAEEKAK